tara:strand:- start:713 stop:1321 length:609 start_codon:yes stop_codon:yes gene_type:complete
MPFWTEQDITPKLKDRFFVLINNELLITAKSVNKPELTFDNKEYKMINHHFKYPGLPKWNTVKITFVDMTGSGTEIATPSGTANLNAAEYLLGLATTGGYTNPDKTGMVSKQDMAKALGDVVIQQISPTALGEESNLKIKVTEEWKLVNPIIKTLTWGDLAYGDDGLVEYSLELDYDYAELSKGQNAFGSPDVDTATEETEE